MHVKYGIFKLHKVVSEEHSKVQPAWSTMAGPPHDAWPPPLEFAQDERSKRRKGALRPQFAEVWTQPGVTLSRPVAAHVFVNPYSGRKKGDAIAQEVCQRLEQANVVTTVHRSNAPGHLVELAREADVPPGAVLLVVGGDGSLSEVITGRFERGSAADDVFGIVPGGTGNSQAHDLAIHSIDDAINTVLGGHVQSLDIGKVVLTEGLPGHEKEPIVRYSHNLVTWGLGVDSTIKAERMRWMGPLRYDVGIVMAILANQRRTAVLEMDGVRLEDDFTLLLIQNSQTGGSRLPLAPGASLDDGSMDIGILKSMTRRQVFRAFGMLKAEGRHVYHPRVDYHRFKTLTITTAKPTAINVDGENLGSTPLELTVLPRAVRLMVPP